MTLALPIRALSIWHFSHYPPCHLSFPLYPPSYRPCCLPHRLVSRVAFSHCRCFPFSFFFFFLLLVYCRETDERQSSSAIHHVASEFSRTIGCQRGLVI